MIADVGSWNVAVMLPVELTPGQMPEWLTANDWALLTVRRCVELFQVLPEMWIGLGTVIEQPKGGDPIVIVATGPEALTTSMSTDVVLVAVNVHVPAVATDVDSSDETLFVQLPQRTGFVVPVSVARSPEAVRFASPVAHETEAPALSVLVPTCVAVSDVPDGSHVAAEADDTPTSEPTSTAASAMRLMLFMVIPPDRHGPVS
jgi:hypothetical protein